MLVFLLFVVCFNGVVSGGKMTTSAGDSSEVDAAEVKSQSHCEGSNPLLFNVKSFGARADGRTDDSNVCSLLFSWKILREHKAYFLYMT